MNNRKICKIGRQYSKNWLTYKTRIKGLNRILKSDLYYLAGLLDGEGCIGLNTVGGKGRQNLHPQITITNTNKEVLDWVAITVGKGKVGKKPRNVPGHKLAYAWRINGINAVRLSKILFPYLKIKKIQAETLMRFEHTIQLKVHRHKLSDEIRNERQGLKDILTKLNKRGTNGDVLNGLAVQ